MRKFKFGDKVRLVKNSTASVNCIGVVGIVEGFDTHPDKNIYKIQVEGNPNYGNWSDESDLELVVDIEYEDKWHLNDGSSTILDDADKLERGGSVVAYRLRKKEPFKFGDIIKDDFGTVVFLRYAEDNGRYGFVFPEKGNVASWEDLTGYSKVK